MKTAFATTELGLRLTIAPIGIAAPVAPLRGMPGVYSDNLATGGLRLVPKESLELGEAPRVKPAFGFPARGFDATSDVSEVFHNDSCPRLNAVKDRSGQDVVAIPSEALFTPSKAFKMSLGTLRTVGLQSTSESEDSLDNFLHMPIAVKVVVRSDGRPGNSQVNADSLAVRSKLNVRQTDDNVKVKLAFTVNKVSCSRRLASRIPGIFREGERHLHSTLSGRQTDNSSAPVYFEGVKVIPGRAGDRLRAAYLTSLLHSGDCRPHSFAGFLPGLDMQVRDKSRPSILTSAISQAMKGVSITCSLLPACAADGIKRLGKLLNRLIKSFSLLLGRLEMYPNCSIHTIIIPYISKYLQVKSKRKVVGT